MADDNGNEQGGHKRVRSLLRSDVDAAVRSGAVVRRKATETPSLDSLDTVSQDAEVTTQGEQEPEEKQRRAHRARWLNDEKPPSAFVTPPDPEAEVPRQAGSTREVLAGPDVDDRSTVERVSTTFRSASMKQRALTAALFAAAAGVAFASGPLGTLVLVAAVITVCAAEFFDAVRRVGFRPATLLGVTATLGVVLGAYAKGEAALPLVGLLLLVFSMMWFLGGVGKAPATINIAVTLFGFTYIGVCAAHAALLLRMPDHRGLAVFIGAVVVTIAYDTAAYIGGSSLGRHHLAKHISPNKTWEGLAVGTLVAILVGGLGLGFLHPWSWLTGLLMGVLVSVIAPIGDLAESMIKRDLGIKDMGRILPGHGGLLDRSDAMLLVLPCAYYLAVVAGIGQ